MVKSCCAYGCQNVWKPNQGIQYHRFPLKSPALLEQWKKACRLENFTPTPHTLICSNHFQKEDYSESTSSKKRLKADVIPSVFNFPTYYQQQNSKRRKLERVYGTKVEVEPVATTSAMCTTKSTQTSPRKVKHPEIRSKNRKIKILQQRLRRRNMKIRTLKDLIKLLRENNKSSYSLENVLQNNFEGLMLHLAKSEIQNSKVAGLASG